MSRFYDALKEAGRSHGAADGTPLESEWETQGAPGSEAPTLNETDISAMEPEPGGDFPKPEPASEALQEDLLHLAGISSPRANGSASPPADGNNGDALNGADVEEPKLDTVSPGQESPSPAINAFQAKTEISFDPSARLIPQAVESIVVEHYRRLRTKILQQHTAKPFQILMVTSPSPQEGKTVTVLNLGLSFAMLPNFKVLVIDGDLRRGTIGKWLDADGYPGLSNVLEGAAQLEDVAIKCANVSMHVVTRGNSKVSPAELLHSPQLSAQMRRMTQHFDLILVDSPPVTLITDAQLLAGSCDAVLLIARAFRTKRKSLEQAVQDLNAFRIIGTVLNGGTRAQLYHGGYSGYY